MHRISLIARIKSVKIIAIGMLAPDITANGEDFGITLFVKFEKFDARILLVQTFGI